MPLLSHDVVDAQLATLPGWSRRDARLERRCELPSFMAAVALIQRIAAVAEAQDHHPDIHLSYRTLSLSLSSHDAGGLTQRDLALARALSPLLDGAA